MEKDAKKAGARPNIKNFGLVRAIIDDDAKRITLSFSERGKQPLDDKHPQRCLGWAVTALSPLIDEGYILALPEAVPVV